MLSNGEYYTRTKEDACIMRRHIFIISLILMSSIMSIGLLVARTGVGWADNTPPAPAPGAFASGTWQGQGSLANGHSVFDLTLTLNITNSTFAGDMRSVSIGSEATINGAVSSSYGNIIGLTFTTSQVIQGNVFQLGNVYSGTFTGGRIRGSWTTQGHTTTPVGFFTLDPMTPITPVATPNPN